MYVGNDVLFCRIRAYVTYNWVAWKWILYLCIWGNLALAVFEEPAIPGCALPYWVCEMVFLDFLRKLSHEMFPLSERQSSLQATMMFEVVFLTYFIARWFHHMYFEEAHVFWKDPKNITVLVISTVSVL